MVVLGHGYLSQNLHSFELMLGSIYREVIYFMISQKRKHLFKSNKNCKSKGKMCTSLN